ncbi:MAG: hypothetical protein ACKV2T_25530 [Kofleriaceae bacterium]
MPRARVFAAILFAIAACGDDTPRRSLPETLPSIDRAVADLSLGITTDLDGPAPAFGDAVLAELLGDEVTARAGYEKVLADADSPASLAAKSALHLAQLESLAGRSRHALDLVVRAAALAPGDIAIAEGVAQLRADTVAASGEGNIRAPRIGTPLAGVDPKVAEAFATAERAMAKVHRLRPRPFIEALSSSIRAKELATEDVVASYRAVADAGGLAGIAGHYRAGSLYHDLALGLLFELPPELDPNVAAGLRRTLRGRAQSYLKKAVAEYELALAATAAPDSELWRLAAEADLRAARDVLGEGN